MKEPFLSSGTDYGVGGHRYNDDLLLAAEVRERAKQEHAEVYHVLDHLSLRDAFRRENDPANRAKRHSHVAGFWAVTLALVALLGAASEPLWIQLESPWPRIIVIASAALGLLSIFISVVWLVYGKRKSTWLYGRLYTERLRQFHFQSFVWRFADIVESMRPGEENRREYQLKRELWFNAFEHEMIGKGDAQLSALLQPTALPVVWLHANASNDEEPMVPNRPDVNLQSIFRAYEVFRFDEQQGYAEFMLRLSNRPDPAKAKEPPLQRLTWLWYPGMNQPLRTKRKVLTAIWTGALVALVLLHLGLLGSHLVGWHYWEGALAHVMIVWVALLAVAVKTLSEGFALTREVERYEEYRAVVNSFETSISRCRVPTQKAADYGGNGKGLIRRDEGFPAE